MDTEAASGEHRTHAVGERRGGEARGLGELLQGEGIGPVGSAEAIAATATTLLKKKYRRTL